MLQKYTTLSFLLFPYIVGSLYFWRISRFFEYLHVNVTFTPNASDNCPVRRNVIIWQHIAPKVHVFRNSSFMIKTSYGSAAAQWKSAWLETAEPRVQASPVSLRCGPWAIHINPSLVLVQPQRKTRPCLTERLLMGRKESNQTNKDRK